MNRFVLAIVCCLSLSGCAALSSLLPIIAEVITTVQDAEQILNEIDRHASSHFQAHPDQDAELKYRRALLGARTALNEATRAANPENFDPEKVDAALSRFRLAYKETIQTLQPLGIIQPDKMQGQPGQLPALLVRQPLALEE